MNRFFMLSVLFLSSCTPALQNSIANSINQSTQQAQIERETKARQTALDSNPPILRAECYARDGLMRVNRLQQGPNWCFVSALTSQKLGSIERLRLGMAKYYSSKKEPITEIEDFEQQDSVFNGSRVAIIYPILMPDSLTGAAFATTVGLAKAILPKIVEIKARLLGIPLDISNDPNLKRFLNPTSNFASASERFDNRGERPYTAFLQIMACSDLCVKSPLLELQTR